MENEEAYTIIEHALTHIESETNADNGNDMFDAAHILLEAWKAIGPLGQIPGYVFPHQ